MPYLIAFSAGVSVGELVDVPGRVLIGELLLDLLVGEVLHCPGIYLIQSSPSLLWRVNVSRSLYGPLEPGGPYPQP